MAKPSAAAIICVVRPVVSHVECARANERARQHDEDDGEREVLCRLEHREPSKPLGAAASARGRRHYLHRRWPAAGGEYPVVEGWSGPTAPTGGGVCRGTDIPSSRARPKFKAASAATFRKVKPGSRVIAAGLNGWTKGISERRRRVRTRRPKSRSAGRGSFDLA